MIKKNPAHDVDTPPGQIVSSPVAPETSRPQPVKYLRDVIKKYQDENKKEGAYNPFKEEMATQVLTEAEKRLERLLGVLESLARQAELRQGPKDGWWAFELRQIIKENS